MYFLLQEVSFTKGKELLQSSKFQWSVVLICIIAFLCGAIFYFPLEGNLDESLVHSLTYTESGEKITIPFVRNSSFLSESVEWGNGVTIDPAKMSAAEVGFVATNGELPAEIFVTFSFAPGERIVFSVLPERRQGKTYSPSYAFLGKYKLVYLAAREPDIFGEYRKEKRIIRFYPLNIDPRKQKKLFTAFLEHSRKNEESPVSYHPFFRMVSREVFENFLDVFPNHLSWNSPLLSSDDFEQYLYDHKIIPHNGSFAEEQVRHTVNLDTEYFDTEPDFSLQIRRGRGN